METVETYQYTTCFNCNQEVRLNADFEDGKLIRLYCSRCGAEVRNIEPETRVKLEAKVSEDNDK